MKCFDNIPNSGASYSASLYVDIPDNNNIFNAFSDTANAGHVLFR